MQLPKIDVQHQTLSQLLAEMQCGRLQVPRFQRDFVWPVTKTRALLDSMYKEFPIGSFFLWRVPPCDVSLIRPLEDLGIPSPPPGTPIALILDGQQRLTSLYVAMQGLRLGGRDYSKVSIDLQVATAFLANSDEGFDEDIFVYKVPDNRRTVAVHDLVGPSHMGIYEQVPAEWRNAFMRANQVLQTYPFSVVWIQEQSLGDAIVIFQRINQAGKRLSRYDLVCANVWTKEFDLRRQVETVNRALRATQFGELDETVFTQALALVIKDRCTTAAELSLTSEEIQRVWDPVIEALRLAVAFAVGNLGCRRAEFVPYRGMLAVLAACFYHLESSVLSAAQRTVLWRWFWQVALSERYASTSPSRMAEDALKLRALLHGEIADLDYGYRVTPQAVLNTKMTTSSSALRNAVLCMLALREPRNLKDNSPVDLSDRFFTNLKQPERHHVFPVGYLKRKGLASARLHNVPNFVFIPSDLNSAIASRPPSEYMAELRQANPGFAGAAASHLIPVADDSPIWSNDFESFMQQRAELIAEALNAMAAGSPPSGNEGLSAEELLAQRVDAFEVRLRDFLDGRLTAVVGERYWKQVVPGDVIQKAKERIERHTARHPFEAQADSASGRRRLDFVDVDDYRKIILHNWSHFLDILVSKRDIQRHLEAYRDLRNAVQHVRKPTETELGLGNVAMVWLGRVMDRYDVRTEQDAAEEAEEDPVAEGRLV